MIRVRFICRADDHRPVDSPEVPWNKHPWWCTGYTSGHAIIVAWADDMKCLKARWPEVDEAEVDILEENAFAYTYSSRFPQPEWFNEIY